MRIAYVSLDPGIPVFGAKGAAVHVQAMTRAFLALGADVTILSPRCEGGPPPGLDGVRLRPLPLPPDARGEDRLRALIALDDGIGAVLDREGPFDLVYERHALLSCGAMEWAAARSLPSVLEVNAPLIDEQARHRTMLLPDEAAARTGRAMRAARLVAAVTPPVADYCRAHGARAALHLPNAIDPGPLDLPRVPGRPFTVGFLGGLRPWHDLDTLLAAMEMLRPDHPDLHLLIVGDGPERARLAPRLDALGAGITGLVPHHEVPGWLARMDVGVAPYSARQEFYFSPLKLYEYMGARLPVIASAVGDLPQIVADGETGLICAPDDPRVLAGAILRLARDPQRAAAMGHAGHRHVTARHTWRGNAERVLRAIGLPSDRAA